MATSVKVWSILSFLSVVSVMESATSMPYLPPPTPNQTLANSTEPVHPTPKLDTHVNALPTNNGPPIWDWGKDQMSVSHTNANEDTSDETKPPRPWNSVDKNV